MIELKIQNYNSEEKQILANALATALLSVPCDLDKSGHCKGTKCKNHKICTDLSKAHCFATINKFNGRII